MLTADDLRAFTAALVPNVPTVRAPVHLCGGNEDELVAYFSTRYHPGDWVFSTWRSYYHALLAGVPPAEVRERVLAGQSITLCFPEHRFFTSAIVAGHLPIAVGVAMGLKRVYDRCLAEAPDTLAIVNPRVNAFCGDMAAETGTFHECQRYAANHHLPITFVVEDNGVSVCTPTRDAWGSGVVMPTVPSNVHRYAYTLPYPHAGAPQARTQF